MSRARGLAVGLGLGLVLLVAWAVVPARAQHDAPREAGWELRIAERTELAEGATAPLTIALAVDRGLAVSKDAAVILDLDPDPGAAVKKKRFGRGDAVDPEADAPRFAIAVRGDAAGEHVVRVHLRFWLCGGKSCRPIDVRRSAIVAVGVTHENDAGIDAGSGPAGDAGARVR